MPRGEGEGAHVLRVSLDGEGLKPDNVRVLNKTAVYDVARPAANPIPLYDPQKTAWFLKEDSDYVAYNSGIENDPYNQPGWAVLSTRAYSKSHYYEYLFCFNTMARGDHELRLESIGPQSVHVAQVSVRQPEHPFVVSTIDWMEEVFPWQAPTADTVLTNGLRVVGCSGEYEPLTFSVFALGQLAGLEVKLGSMDAEGSEHRVLNAEHSLFSVQTLRREALGEAEFIARIPFVPKDWKRQSPELLVPIDEEKPTVPRFQTQRFYVDVKIPEGAAPGIYRGEVELSSTGRVLTTIPFECDVLPFELAKSPADYWMWRLTWSPIWQPENVACLRDIAEHGYTGLARICGAGFKFSIDADDNVQVDASSIEKLARVLKETGLAPQSADTGICGALLGTICKHLGLEFTDMPQQLPLLEDYFRERLAGQEAVSQANGLLKDKGADLMSTGDSGADALGGLGDDILATESSAQKEARIAVAAKQKAEETQQKIEALAIQGFRKVKQVCDNLGLTIYVFPIDEPCGTPWKRRWTAYTARLAKLGGMETFSTRNDWTWQAHIDHGAAGGMINSMYQPPELVSQPYHGDLRIPRLPLIGAFRDGEKYHFKGELDEVRIYNRALTEKEILAQHETPAESGLIAYYSFDEHGSASASAPKDDADRLPAPPAGCIADESGHGNAARVVGGASFTAGRIGQSISLNGIDQHLQPIPSREGSGALSPQSDAGWSISLWVKGRGPLFGHGYDFYTDGARAVRFTTTEEDKKWFIIGGKTDPRFWSHLTLVFDPSDHMMRAYTYDQEIRDWHRKNIDWNYMQVRSMPPKNPRYKTGVMAWSYANHGALKHITTFCYDWNASNLYVVYPKGGDRFSNGGSWYRTVGWEGCREGIDDARYLQTLVEVLEKKRGMNHDEAVAEVERRFAPLTVSYRGINRVITEMGGYGEMRRRIVAEIMAELRRPVGGDADPPGSELR